jgi:RNA 3'-terminal phosphate cyclase (ATP)
MSTILIDGSEGEGGGQILRTALSLSMVTGQPFRMEKIRAGRPKPGLKRQHLTSVEAAATVSQAIVEGAFLESESVEFLPGKVVPGTYSFDVGSAGSATLVLQTVLPPLLTADGVSRLTVTGGTHNPAAPPYDFLLKTFGPQLERFGPRLEWQLERPGFFPAGGGRFFVTIFPVPQLVPVEWLARSPIRRRTARALISRTTESMARRQLAVVRQRLDWGTEECLVEPVPTARGPGQALLLEMETDEITTVFSGFPDRDRTPEDVANEAIDSVERWMQTGVVVDEHLADQLLIPMTLAGGGRFRTTEPSSHTRTNASIIRRFMEVDIRFDQESSTIWLVTVSGKPCPFRTESFTVETHPHQ